ncbi:MAG: Jag N-terminal domain-containing protein [Sulfuricurvum sp.]|jgi:spoIIIJ-associated protein
MKKIEADTLEQAYSQAATEFECSVTQLQVEIIQFPSKGVLGMFKKPAIIVANPIAPATPEPIIIKEVVIKEIIEPKEVVVQPLPTPIPVEEVAPPKPVAFVEQPKAEILLDDAALDTRDEALFGLPEEDEEDDFYDNNSMELAYDEMPIDECAVDVKAKITQLFADTCFNLNEIKVSAYDEHTLLVEISGADSALMIGKEGYRYKALSYMLFNWINATYGLQLRLEIAEFLRNQEESIERYLIGVCESVDRDGRAQTKVLDGVLVQIALTQLRNRYPNRYVAIRSNREGGKFIIINSYHEY